ncbi:3'(2'),5'-bisphosphate nucleotidase-like [Primulina huaijiensis]|uniref:3'(2'),5'-bisphosphate nucleotidase-like n=1 Tax=Primulina huaijiensis TaxID=1492673 RepID=UPI003CC795AB
MRFLRGDQYAIALALLDEGKIVLGVLACPNLPLGSVTCHYQRNPDSKVGCLFFAQLDAGTYLQSLDGSSPMKVHKLGVIAPSVRIDSQVKYEAGGAADAGGNPLDFSRGRYLDLDTGIIVTNHKLMPSLLKANQESIKEKAFAPY